MEIRLPHQLTYTNADSITVANVASSLLANEQLFKEICPLLEAAFPGLVVDRISIDFKSALVNTPLKEILYGTIFVAYQKDLEKVEHGILEKLLGHPLSHEYDTLATVLVLLLAVYGIDFAYKKLTKKKGEPTAPTSTPSITGDYNTIIQIGGDLLGVGPDALADALQRMKPQQKGRIARTALQLIAPAKRETGATIEGDGLRLSPQTVQDAPAIHEAYPDDEDESQEPLTDQKIVIHATDLDSNKTGWAGHLPEVSDKRLRMRLYPTVKPEDLFAQKEIKADVILVSKRDAAGDYIPYLIHVVAVR